MRKLILSSLLLFSFSASRSVQAQCGARYDQEIFSNVQITSNVVYGSNVDNTGATLSLTMDIYQPDGDTLLARPLIVWVHGGSFIGGTKNDPDVTALCNRFAKRGYVCASINYRLGMSTPNQTNATKAVYRAVQDMKAAVRYFRQDAAGPQVYRIDPNTIFGGGSSAGGFTALHLAYLDQPSELPSQIDTVAMGGLEGNSGNPGYPSNINAVVNLCGALGDKTWMTPGEEPLCSMHGTVDNTVPYSNAMLYMLNVFPIMVVDGSYAIHGHANQIGVPNVMYTYFGAGHVPYVASAAYMDTTVRFVSNFLYNQLGCPPSDPNPYPNTYNSSTGVAQANAISDISVFPQPASGHLFIRSSEKLTFVEMLDMSGRSLISQDGGDNLELSLGIESLAAGTYVLRLHTEKGVVVTKAVKE
jgi:alpha/beta superfamily hydrolase